MAENLKVTHYNNGDDISYQSNEDFGSYDEGQCGAYNNNPSNATIYGNLYNWAVVGDNRGVCPDGFHVPTDEQFMELEMYLGMSEEEANSFGWRGTDEGSQLKANSDLWINGGGVGTSGFNALPAGYCSPEDGGNCIYYEIGELIMFWTSYSNGNDSRLRELGNISLVGRFGRDKQHGLSIRCMTYEWSEETGCTNPEACNYDETATADDGSCEYEYDCAGTCGGDLEWDCAGICGGDNSSYDGCCGLPPNDDCTDDCVTDDLGQCCTPQDVDGCGICFGDGDGTDCNNDGVPDDCEEVYNEGYDVGNAEGYTAGLEEGILLGGQSGDANGDGTLDVLDIVYFIDVILNP